MSNAAHLRGSAQWISFPRVVCQQLGAPQRPRAGGADGRRRAHRALLDRLGHQARAGGRDRAGALHRQAPRATSASALRDYEARAQRRGAEASRTRRATRPSGSRTSTRYVNLPPEQFAYSLLTRSQRISHENLRLRDKGYVEDYEDWIAERAGRAAARRCSSPIPPMFTPFTRARRHAEEPRRRLADGAVLVRRRHARRLPPRAPRRARAWAAPAWWSPR